LLGIAAEPPAASPAVLPPLPLPPSPSLPHEMATTPPPSNTTIESARKARCVMSESSPRWLRGVNEAKSSRLLRAPPLSN
jgi:hypothetical protein